MRLSFPSSIQRIALRFLASSSLTHIASILLVFIPIRVFLSLREFTPSGDGHVVAGQGLGQFWLGGIPWTELMNGPVGDFVAYRTNQLLYPVLISLQGPIGWSLETHLIVLNTVLGATLIVGSYFTALRLWNKTYAVLVALLMCSLTSLYWIARWGVPDNLLYAMLPLFGLSVINWYQEKTRKSLTVMLVSFVAFAFTRPEAVLVILAVTSVLAWDFLRRYRSKRFLIGGLFLAIVTVCIATTIMLSSSPLKQRSLLSRGHIAWGLSMSSRSLLNEGAGEFNRITAYYQRVQREASLNGYDLWHLMSRDGIEIIRQDPLWYVLKIPLRGLALLYPWTYQPWSPAHVLYDAVYTMFIMTGLVLLIRRGSAQMPLLVLGAIPFAIWLFLSVYGIDNDLKHRNGFLVGLNLIAPLGFFLAPRSQRIGPESDSA